MPETPSFHALRFGRSAARYEANAAVQIRMADALISLWGGRSAPDRVLEFGCGTGLLTRRVHKQFPHASLFATDAAQEMVEIARSHLGDSSVSFATLDAQGTDRSRADILAHAAHVPVDLVISGALVQWFSNLAEHLHFAASLAKPGAAYLVSGFDKANFPELNALLSEPPFSYSNFPGHGQSDLESASMASGWSVGGYLAWDDVEVLPSARAVLQRMQDLGSVRDPREGGRMSRANLAHLLAEYERRFAVEGGVRLTWKPWAALLVNG
jgi:malonyl-CoA O-methyltransferase